MSLRGVELVNTVSIVLEECCVCSGAIALEKRQKENLIATGNFFFCPVGHSQHYESRVAELEKQLAVAQERANQEATRRRTAEEALRGTQQALQTVKGEKGRLELRAVRGVCAYCHRTVSQMARHVKTKHSEKMGKRG